MQVRGSRTKTRAHDRPRREPRGVSFVRSVAARWRFALQRACRQARCERTYPPSGYLRRGVNANGARSRVANRHDRCVADWSAEHPMLTRDVQALRPRDGRQAVRDALDYRHSTPALACTCFVRRRGSHAQRGHVTALGVRSRHATPPCANAFRVVVPSRDEDSVRTTNIRWRAVSRSIAGDCSMRPRKIDRTSLSLARDAVIRSCVAVAVARAPGSLRLNCMLSGLELRRL